MSLRRDCVCESVCVCVFICILEKELPGEASAANVITSGAPLDVHARFICMLLDDSGPTQGCTKRQGPVGPEMVNIKVGISFKRLQFIFFIVM